MADTLQLPPCRVCGGKATGRHFGVVACEACKSFFKRNKNRDKPYKCKGQVQGQCPVKFSKSPICPFCRLQVCLRVGMSRDAIHRGRVPIDIKTELYLEAIDHQLKMEKKSKGEENGSGSAEEENDDIDASSPGTSPPHPNTATPPQNLSPTEGVPQYDTTSLQNITATLHSLEQTSDGSGVDHLEPTIVDAFDIVVPDSPLQTVATDMETSSDDQSSKSSFETFSYGQLLSGQTELFPTACPLIDNYQPLETVNENPDQTEAIDLSVSVSNDNTGQNQNTAPVSGVINDNSISDDEFERLKNLIITAIKIDAASQLYSSEVLQEVALRTINFINNRKAKEQWFGVMEPLPSEVYNEIYQTTGIDLDDYRAKVYSCIQDLKPDIDAFLKYLCRLPDFHHFSLKDRTLIARGGFSGWFTLSSLGVYSTDLQVCACVKNDIIFTMEDFARYFGKVYMDSMKHALQILQKIGVTEEELALIKLIHVYKERPEVGQIEKKAVLEEYQGVLRKALHLVMEMRRGQEQAAIAMQQVLEIFPCLDEMTLAFIQSVQNWPCKFPEYFYPRILLEITGGECEEELLVAVSVQLNIND